MPIETALYPRTRPLCESHAWKEWSGYYAVCRFQHNLDFEYTAIRNRAGLLDVSPLYKTRVRGRDAARLLDRMVPRDVLKARVGQVLYTPWCDSKGKVVDDGTIQRLSEDDFRVTSAYPCFEWLSSLVTDHLADIEDESEAVAGIALQGPTSRHILQKAFGSGIDDLRYFRLTAGQIDGKGVVVSRTGYTGDLGYEIWMDKDAAAAVWDRLMDAGGDRGITPIGLDALDMSRIEAGLILMDVDYYSARRTEITIRKSTPAELGLGWTVSKTKKTQYIGRRALLQAQETGPARTIVGLELDWAETERLFAAEDLPIEIHEGACREPVPVYDHSHQIGYTTSQCWSPILKRSLALATINAPHFESGNQVQVELTVEYQRKTVPATIVKRPFYDPPQKRGSPA